MAEVRTKKLNGKIHPSLTPSEETTAKRIDSIAATFDKLENADRLKVLDKIGVGKDYFTCYRCGNVLDRGKFYTSGEACCNSGVTRICKKCAENIATMTDENGKKSQSKESIMDALQALNKPFINSLWDNAVMIISTDQSAAARRYTSLWTSYISQLNLPYHQALTFQDSDMFNGGKYSLAIMSDDALPKDKEIIEQFEKNKSDVKRLLGYEPFEKEKLSDQPFLYSQLIGFLDSSEDANEDMMRTSSAIAIVRGFLQQAQIDDKIAMLMSDIEGLEKKAPVIKQLQEMKSKVTSVISDLAEQSCISQKHNKNAKKGENTWTGKIRKLKEMNLREQEVNAFDIGTCEGMRQVADISDAAIFRQIRLDENDYTEMLATQRQSIIDLQKKVDEYEEKCRILLRENLDLKSYMSEIGVLDQKMLSKDSILYEPDEIVYEEESIAYEVIEDYEEVESDE